MGNLKVALTVGLVIFMINAKAQLIRVSLYNESPLQTVTVSIPGNAFRLLCDSVLYDNSCEANVYYITQSGSKIMVRDKQKPLGTFSILQLVPITENASYTVTPIVPRLTSRIYSDGLEISVAYNRISLINQINYDNYIAGVVEAETGINAAPEFYKAQAVLARTYLLGHIAKHETEGFNLCDGVHCQAYKGRATRSPVIEKATLETSGVIAMYDDTVYVTAAFHANCGGITESARNAWLNNTPYLIPVKDPFCQNSPAARWEKTIPMLQWRNYLKNHGFKSALKIPYIDFSVVNTERVQYYSLKNDSIPYKQIRSDFQLKSAFFSVSANQNDVVLKGRGYGHGVGMCQEGAMQMAKVGYNYKDILLYYFKGITLVNTKE